MVRLIESPHRYLRTIHFHETDVMGVAHHSNYLKYFEEARVDWIRFMKLEGTHFPHNNHMLAVISSSVLHDSPCRFGDEIEISLQVRVQRLKIEFQYVIYSCTPGHESPKKLVARGHTLHVLVDQNLKPCRPSQRFVEAVEKLKEKQKWIETLL